MTSCSTQSNLMLAPSKSSTEDIVRNGQRPELCITAHGLPAYPQPQGAELCIQSDRGSDRHKDEIE